MIPKFSISKACIKDMKALEEISISSLKSPWDEKAFIEEFTNNEFCKIIVAKQNQEIVGYLDYWITFDSSTVAQIAVKEDFKRLHVGTLLFDFMMEDLFKNDVLYSTLEVRKTNISAIKFYQKMGYFLVCEKPHYYEDGEDALYMCKGIFGGKI